VEGGGIAVPVTGSKAEIGVELIPEIGVHLAGLVVMKVVKEVAGRTRMVGIGGWMVVVMVVAAVVITVMAV